MKRKIIHIDMDCFYASVEMRDNPKLKDIPLAIGGTVKDRGVLCTCNYPARKFGLRSAMSTVLALKLCPQVVLMPPNMKKYLQASELVFKIFSNYTQVIESLSLDEAFLDLSPSRLLSGDAKKIALSIKEEIFKKTGGLTCSAGIAPNKLLAKIASDINKPGGIYEIKEEEVLKFMQKLPVTKLLGVGKVTRKILHDNHIFTCKDLQNFPFKKLSHLLGTSQAQSLHEFSFGRDERELETDSIPQSVSIENTYPEDFESLSECTFKTLNLLYEFHTRFLNHKNEFPQSKPKNIFVKMKFSDFSTVTIEEKRSQEFFEKLQGNILFSIKDFNELFRKAYTKKNYPVRLLGLGIKFAKTSGQLELF